MAEKEEREREREKENNSLVLTLQTTTIVVAPKGIAFSTVITRITTTRINVRVTIC